MKFILNENEINLAIKLYLRANAAVDVHGMEFSAKRDGLIAEVDATVLELTEPSVKPVQVELKEPELTVEFEPSEPEEQFKADPNELVIKEDPIQITQEEKDNLTPVSEPDITHYEEDDNVPFDLSGSPEVSDEDIASIEAASTEDTTVLETDKLEFTTLEESEIHIEEEEETSETEEMPVQNTMSIADILGS